MGTALLTTELALAVQRMVREHLRTNPDLVRARAATTPRLHDYAIRIGKANSNASEGQAVGVSIYRPGPTAVKGSEVDTDTDITAFVRYSTVKQGAWVYLFFIDGGWELLQWDPCWSPPPAP